MGSAEQALTRRPIGEQVVVVAGASSGIGRLARRSVPLPAPYCAAKHGVLGFAESMRPELRRDATGVAISVVLPSSVNTPLFRHARSKLGVMPQPIPPVYDPSAVAHTVLALAERPQPEVVVGGAGKAFTTVERISPRLLDWYLSGPGKGFEKQRSRRADDGADNLFSAEGGDGAAHGEFGEGSLGGSRYTELFELHPTRARVALGLGDFGLALGVRRLGR